MPATAAPMASPPDSQARVELSTSPSSKVTVPVGNMKFPPPTGSPHIIGRTIAGRPGLSLTPPVSATNAQNNIRQHAYTRSGTRGDAKPPHVYGRCRARRQATHCEPIEQDHSSDKTGSRGKPLQ